MSKSQTTQLAEQRVRDEVARVVVTYIDEIGPRAYDALRAIVIGDDEAQPGANELTTARRISQ